MTARFAGFGPMFRKELLEVVRTHRLLVAGLAYLAVGLGSPLLALAVPWLLAHVPRDQLGGVELLLTKDPSVTDAMAQYLKNFSMLPVLAILLSMGTVAGEKQRETLPFLLSKPLSRRACLLAKALAPALVHALGTALAATGCALYTSLLFGPIHFPTFLLVNGLLLLGQWTFLALTLLGSVVSRGTGPAAAIGFGGFFGVMVLGAAPSVARWTPAGTWTAAADLVSGREPAFLAATVLITVSAILLLGLVADRLLSRQEV